jgi:hypothetical protein
MMKNTLNQKMTTEDLSPILGELRSVWTMIAPDADTNDPAEAVELILDRVSGDTGKTVDSLIELYGYNTVARVTANALFR